MQKPLYGLKENPLSRAIYGDEADVDDLAKSLKETGQLTPLLIKPDGTILSGHRRYRAARKAGLITLNVEVRTPRDKAEHLCRFANLWRTTGDFWDDWNDLYHAFEICHEWEGVGGPGHWPDADMLPFGHLAIRATERGLKVLYCIGEKSEEQSEWRSVLGKQLDEGLAGVDRSQVVIGYEPVWSIGPGKTPAGKDYITMIARFVKERTGGLDVVYGGGLKTDNAEMLASIAEIDGGLIALTRFSGEIGWYPNEYLDIIRLYLGK